IFTRGHPIHTEGDPVVDDSAHSVHPTVPDEPRRASVVLHHRDLHSVVPPHASSPFCVGTRLLFAVRSGSAHARGEERAAIRTRVPIIAKTRYSRNYFHTHGIIEGQGPTAPDHPGHGSTLRRAPRTRPRHAVPPPPHNPRGSAVEQCRPPGSGGPFRPGCLPRTRTPGPGRYGRRLPGRGPLRAQCRHQTHPPPPGG